MQGQKEGRPYILHVTQVMNSDRLVDLYDGGSRPA